MIPVPQLQVPLVANRTLTVKYVPTTAPPPTPREPQEDKDYVIKVVSFPYPTYYVLGICKWCEPLGSVYFLRSTVDAARTAVVEHIYEKHRDKLMGDP